MLGQTLDGNPQTQPTPCRQAQDRFARVEEELVPRASHHRIPRLRYGWTQQGRATSKPWNAQAGSTYKPTPTSLKPRHKTPNAARKNARREISTKESEVTPNEG